MTFKDLDLNLYDFVILSDETFFYKQFDVSNSGINYTYYLLLFYHMQWARFVRDSNGTREIEPATSLVKTDVNLVKLQIYHRIRDVSLETLQPDLQCS